MDDPPPRDQQRGGPPSGGRSRGFGRSLLAQALAFAAERLWRARWRRTFFPRTDQAENRRRAAMAFSRMGAPREAALPTLLRILQDPDATVRFWAVRALAERDLWTPATEAAFLQLLHDPDADGRWAAADRLDRKGIGHAVEHPRPTGPREVRGRWSSQ